MRRWLAIASTVWLAACSPDASTPNARAPQPGGSSPSPTPGPRAPSSALGADELRRRLRERDARVAEALLAHAQPCAVLDKQNGEAPPRSSHFGGAPDLPPDTPWPEHDGAPLAFLVQIDLAQLPTGCDLGLPRRGLLSFFYDAVEQPWGIDEKSRGRFAVLHTADVAHAQRREPPITLPRDARFRAVPIALRAAASLPSASSDPALALGLSDDEGEALDNAKPTHQLGGLPRIVQHDDMEQACAAHHRDTTAAQWTLLLQLGSDDDAGWMWGDLGTLYFWIHRSDLARGDFSKVWLQLQCY